MFTQQHFEIDICFNKDVRNNANFVDAMLDQQWVILILNVSILMFVFRGFEQHCEKGHQKSQNPLLTSWCVGESKGLMND